jgi:hypothetical protein
MIEKIDLNEEHIDFIFDNDIWGEHEVVAICANREDAIRIMNTNRHYGIKAICSMRSEMFIVMSFNEIIHD